MDISNRDKPDESNNDVPNGSVWHLPNGTIVSKSGNYIAMCAEKQLAWRISDCKKKSIGSRKKRGAAVVDLEDLDAGMHKSQKELHKPVTRELPNRDSKQTNRGGVLKAGNWRPGLGRGDRLPLATTTNQKQEATCHCNHRLNRP